MTTLPYVIGVDPGKDGAMAAVVNGLLPTHFLRKTPIIQGDRNEYDLTGMRSYLEEIQERARQEFNSSPVTAIIERQQAFPKQGGSSNFSIGYGFGLWIGLFTAMGIRYEVVSPQAWQKAMLAGIRKKNTKQASVVAAQRLWPGVDFRKSERARKQDSGLTDAALLAQFGWRLVAPAGVPVRS